MELTRGGQRPRIGNTMATTVTSARARPRGISFSVHVWKEDGTYVAYAPELDVSSCGKTLAQAKARLREAVELFAEEAARMGTLDEILAEAGFQVEGKTYRPRRVLAREKVRLELPAAS